MVYLGFLRTNIAISSGRMQVLEIEPLRMLQMKSFVLVFEISSDVWASCCCITKGIPGVFMLCASICCIV